SHQIWVCDITYVTTSDGFAYLSLITDGYSHKIVGYGFRLDLSVQGCLDALCMAQQQWPALEKLIHHSDRGSQYASKAYLEQLKSSKEQSEDLIVNSMSRKRSPQDNPVGE
ncbi:MAG: DDE-type integrase/transposase/recombinase, partial [Erythrobacter sp.]|nr:DDE-type integrase/transposase/recombinase [Erythrobacter sp.]